MDFEGLVILFFVPVFCGLSSSYGAATLWFLLSAQAEP